MSGQVPPSLSFHMVTGGAARSSNRDDRRAAAAWCASDLDEGVLAISVQVLSSGRNVIVLLILASAFDSETFGYVAVLSTITYGALEWFRAVACHPLAPFFGDRTKDDQWPLAGSLLTAVGWSLPAAFFAFFLSLTFAPGPGGVLAVGLGLSPFVIAYDTLRTGSLHLGRPARAVALDAIWLGLLLPAILIAIALGATATFVVTLWAVTAAMVAVLATFRWRLPIRKRSLDEFRQRVGGRGFDMAGQVLFEAVPSRLVTVTIAVLTTAAAAGSIRGAELLLGPSLMVWSGLVPVGQRYARRRVEAGQNRVAVRHSAMLFGILLITVGTNLILIVIMPDRWGSVILGDIWLDARRFVVPVGMMWASLIVLSLITIMLRAVLQVRRAKNVAALAALFAVMSVIPVTVLVSPRAGLLANAASVTAGTAVGAVVLKRTIVRDELVAQT